ncbi:MAG TPA: nicotinamide-nucleotide amidohydrolase family protein [Alphaproteobacteria bacterium]|nr:nicotinamide-nucleotide amidohydrolase family protein [Alphaproteobacteria bacterium]
MITTAESCTGGLIAGCLTEIAGSSDAVDRGFITYSNAAKQTMLGVTEEMLIVHGAVSEPVARAMAKGALARSDAHLAMAVTGVAGPGGGTIEKPVGLVHFGLATRTDATRTEHYVFGGNRQAVRLSTVEHAVAMLASVASP